jgi:RNA polymerase sigma-70 factor (sigma-E family)
MKGVPIVHGRPGRLRRRQRQVSPIVRPLFGAASIPAEPALPGPLPIVVDEIAELHARHYVRLVRLAVALIDHRESAEEVVQDAFLATIRRWDQLRDQSAAQAYLRRAVINGSRDRLRARRVRRAASAPEADHIRSPEDEVLMLEEHRALLAALRMLPLRQREVLVLRYFSDLSERETADAVGISVGGVKSSAHRGMAALRSLLGDCGPDGTYQR